MPNNFFQFKQFTIHQDRCAMKVTTDACLFGAWVAGEVGSRKSEVRKILDIGTGSGLLALMLAQAAKFSIDAIEIDNGAFEQASENVEASPWAERIKVLHGDARKLEFAGQYDIIISNPPFYQNELKSDDTKKNLAHHSQELLLPELFAIIKKNLKPDGSFYLLLPYKRNEEIKKLFIESDFSIGQMIFVRQSVNHDYFRIMLTGQLKTDNQIETGFDEISIKDNFPASLEQPYTSSFIHLLKKYYLHL